jgi:hypothetical protein
MAPEELIFDVVPMILDKDFLDRVHIVDEQSRPSGEVQRDEVAILSRGFSQETELVVAERQQVPKERYSFRPRGSMRTGKPDVAFGRFGSRRVDHFDPLSRVGSEQPLNREDVPIILNVKSLRAGVSAGRAAGFQTRAGIG